MPIHIGQILESIANKKGYTQKQVGSLINKHEKTVADIYKRESISLDLVFSFCQAYNIDLFKLFYVEEPLKSLRDDEISQWENDYQQLSEKYQHLNEKLKLAMDLIDAQKKVLDIEELKKRIERVEQSIPLGLFPSSVNEEEGKWELEPNASSLQDDIKQNDSAK